MYVAPETEPQQSMGSKFAAYKWTIFISMYLGYVLYMLNRKCFTFAAPALLKEGLQKDDLGMIASSQTLAYTGSKFLGGLMSDRVSPKLMYVVGLFLCGCCTVVFTWFNDVWMFSALWFLSGLAQGAGWPACAKMLKSWFHPNEIGTWWSVLSTSMNLACSTGPLIATYIILNSGWRTSMFIFGSLAMGMTAISMVTLVNCPEDVGLPPVGAAAKPGDKGKPQKGRGTAYDLCVSPLMWLLCLGYLVVYIVRTACMDWGQLFLIQEKGQSQIMASTFVSTLETGGIVGSILSGYLSDMMVKNFKKEDQKSTPRMWIMLIFLAILIGSVHMMIFMISPASSTIWITFVGFCLGLGIYGPSALYGVMAMESAPTHLTGTSNAITALAANIGAIIAGLPFASMAKTYNWSGAFFVAECLLGGVLAMMIVCKNIEYKMVPTKKKSE